MKLILPGCYTLLACFTALEGASAQAPMPPPPPQSSTHPSGPTPPPKSPPKAPPPPMNPPPAPIPPSNPPAKPPPQNPPPGAYGGPLPGLTSAQLADFNVGLTQFQEVATIQTGLGPIYNNVSCIACHSSPQPGGGSDTLETRFGRMTDGVFDPLVDLGGSLLQQFAINPACLEVVPEQANVTAQRRTTPLFGFGLIEAIPDSAIQANAARPARDGVQGRAALVLDVASGEMRVGRFGWKAQEATLLSFAGDAYLNEIGVTNRLFPTENAPNGNVALLDEFEVCSNPQDLPDPATGKADIDRQADFMRLLAPPRPLPPTRSSTLGRGFFTQIGCALCHLPTMTTGSSTIAALNRKPVPLWSDLLLHDMGSLGDGIAQADAGTTEMRTAPLWGLHEITTYLHDGRATTLDQAIRDHDGEAKNSVTRYLHLSRRQQQELLDFLDSL